MTPVGACLFCLLNLLLPMTHDLIVVCSMYCTILTVHVDECTVKIIMLVLVLGIRWGFVSENGYGKIF